MPPKQAKLKPANKLVCPGSTAQEEQAWPIAIQPGSDPGEALAGQPERPYRDYVQGEARRYWQEICKIGSLKKPELVDMYSAVPIRRDARYSARARIRYAETETASMQPRTEPGTTSERPYQAFVESAAREYWEETGKEHNLTKPTRQEIRAAAMPVLCRALRNRTGHRRHQAVAGMAQHAREQGWIKWPFSEARASSSYIDALVQLADDANWLAREIPLPDHPPPRHPPIYYTIGSRHGRPVPVPRGDAVIRGDYLYKSDGSRVTGRSKIFPAAYLKGQDWRLICHSSVLPETRRWVLNRQLLDNVSPIYYGLTFERAGKPVNRRGVCVWFDWKEETGNTTSCFCSQLRDYPYPSDLVFSPHPLKDSRD